MNTMTAGRNGGSQLLLDMQVNLQANSLIGVKVVTVHARALASTIQD